MENGIEFDLNLEHLRECMKNSIVRFSYEKKDGEIRDALGTLNPSIIEEHGGSLPKGTGVTHADVFPYWDVNSKGWRGFKIENYRWAELDVNTINNLYNK